MPIRGQHLLEKIKYITIICDESDSKVRKSGIKYCDYWTKRKISQTCHICLRHFEIKLLILQMG